nr:MAG TPA: hypothetical protein [Caudoviricetes sp.]
MASVSNDALLSGVPISVGASSRVMSNTFSCPSTGVSLTRPGYVGTLSFIFHPSPAKTSPL